MISIRVFLALKVSEFKVYATHKSPTDDFFLSLSVWKSYAEMYRQTNLHSTNFTFCSAEFAVVTAHETSISSNEVWMVCENQSKFLIPNNIK